MNPPPESSEPPNLLPPHLLLTVWIYRQDAHRDDFVGPALPRHPHTVTLCPLPFFSSHDAAKASH